MALTDKKRLEILLAMLDQDIEEAASFLEDRNRNILKTLNETTEDKVIMLIMPSISECNVDPKELIELIRERLAIVLKKKPAERSLTVQGDAPIN